MGHIRALLRLRDITIWEEELTCLGPVGFIDSLQRLFKLLVEKSLCQRRVSEARMVTRSFRLQVSVIRRRYATDIHSDLPRRLESRR